MGSIEFASTPHQCTKHVPRAVIPVVRYEYKNLFHQMTDFLNAFMVTELAGVDFSEAQVRVVTFRLPEKV